MNCKEKRKKAMAKSYLPYSFGYKIRAEFDKEKCPICNCVMGQGEFGHRLKIPTIQHNIPLSKGGTHSIDNISVVCRACNVSIKDNVTQNLNNDKVKRVWKNINKAKK